MNPTSFFAELHSIAMFFETILLVACFTGGGIAVLIGFGYELTQKRRMP